MFWSSSKNLGRIQIIFRNIRKTLGQLRILSEGLGHLRKSKSISGHLRKCSEDFGSSKNNPT